MMAISSAAAAETQSTAATWPSKSFQLITPFPPGGGTDIVARTLANKLQERFGKPFIVDNRPGAGGLIGTQQTAVAAPDGYTAVIGITNTFAINPTFYRSLPYDPVKDFQPVAMLATSPHVFVISVDTPAKTLDEYIRYCREHRGSLSYASYGSGSTSQLITEMFKHQNGLDLVHVPYKGIPPALADLVSNQVSMLVSSSAPAVPLVQSGKLRALAVYGDKRLVGLPEVPTMAELGYKDADLQIWYGLFAPAGTPQAIVEKMNLAVREALAGADVQDSFAKAGLYTSNLSVVQFSRFVREEAVRWESSSKYRVHTRTSR